MATVCSTRYFILDAYPSLSNAYYQWDKIDKVVRIGIYASITDYYVLNPGSIIDVIQEYDRAYAITKKELSDGEVINKILLYSTSGSPFNTLVTAFAYTNYITIKMYSSVSKEETELSFPWQMFDNASPPNEITPCFNNFALSEGTIITSWCDGFTLNEVVYRTSPEGIFTDQTFNSITCGYSPPIDQFRFSEEIEIEYRQCILQNPVMFVWKTFVGGWDYFLFEKTQIETLDTETTGDFVQYYNTISDTFNPLSENGKEGSLRILYGATDLTDSQKEGLKGLLLSNKVYQYNESNKTWKPVKVITGSFPSNTNDKLHKLQFEIQDVQINTIKN